MPEDSWSKQEEAKIHELMDTFKLTRPEAIKKMQVLKYSNKWKPTDYKWVPDKSLARIYGLPTL